MTNVHVEIHDTATAYITVSRPQVLNALDAATITELHDAFHALSDDAAVRSVVFTGAGDRAFIAGADIAELARMSAIRARETARRGQALCDRIEGLGKPVIAALNGLALGGGCEVAMACTLRLAADTVKIGQPEINLGLIPGFGGSQRLPRLVGRGTALEMLLTGDPVTAEEALRIGLVNRVVPASQLRADALALAETLATKPPVAVRYILDAVGRGLQMSLAEGCEYEAALFGLVTATDDCQEGTQAFLEKRPAEFKGR